MCQLSCEPPEVLSVTRLQTPQISEDVPGCLPPHCPLYLPGHNQKLPDCRLAAAAHQNGETGPSHGPSRRSILEHCLLGPGRIQLLLARDTGGSRTASCQGQMGIACIFQWVGGEGAATLAFSHERWHGVKGHKSILKLAPLKNPNTIKRHIPEPKNKHKTRHFLRHEGPSQEHCGLQVPR